MNRFLRTVDWRGTIFKKQTKHPNDPNAIGMISKIVIAISNFMNIKQKFGNRNSKMRKIKYFPNFQKIKMIHQHDKIEPPNTVHESKFQNSNYNLVKIGIKFENFIHKLRGGLTVPN